MLSKFSAPHNSKPFFYSMKSVSRTMDPINASENFSSVNLRLISFELIISLGNSYKIQKQPLANMHLEEYFCQKGLDYE